VKPHSRWTTKRVAFSVVGIVLATVLVYTGKMDGDAWVRALVVVIAGHHLEDIVKAWKGGA